MADKYENITKTANTLWNNDESGQIAYAEQIKDGEVKWDDPSKKYNGSYPDPTEQDPSRKTPYIPAEWKTEDNKFQNKLNEFFLNHWADWQHFLHEEGLNPQTIDTWKELEEFLKGIGDSEAFTLLSLIESMEQQAGHLAIGMDDNIPGLMVATSTSDVVTMEDSHIDEQTGIIKIVYNIN